MLLSVHAWVDAGWCRLLIFVVAAFSGGSLRDARFSSTIVTESLSAMCQSSLGCSDVSLQRALRNGQCGQRFACSRLLLVDHSKAQNGKLHVLEGNKDSEAVEGRNPKYGTLPDILVCVLRLSFTIVQLLDCTYSQST